nr:hypothetical protein [Tolivirales sp.]
MQQQLCAPGLTTQRDVALIDIMRVSDKSSKRWRHTTWWGRIVLKYPILRTICCLDEGNLEDVMFDMEIRDHTRDAMKLHTDAVGNAGVETEMMSIYKETGYDMGRCAEQANEELARKRAELASSGPTVEEAVRKHCRETNEQRDVVKTTSVDAEQNGQMSKKVVKHRGRVQLVPAFISAVTMALKSKFGHMAASEANRLLIEREYLKICREATVRHVDIAHHRQFVINTFFNETLMDEVALSRPRMPAWVRRLFAREQTPAPTIC